MIDLPDYNELSEHVYDYAFDPANLLRILGSTSFSGSAGLNPPFESVLNGNNASRSSTRSQWPGGRQQRVEQSRRDYTPAHDYSQAAEAEQPSQFWRNRFRRM